jgi:hypothetical protein
MPAFDCFLLDPSPEALVAAMVEAVETANKRCRKGLLKPDETAFRRLAKDITARPEGVERRCRVAGKGTRQRSAARATLLGVAWWTDPVGRRHVRVVGRRLLPFSEFHLNRFGPPDAETPPLVLIDPDHCFVRHRPGRAPELLVCCECGATGSPAEVAWVVGRCGPCHDWAEEHGRPRARRPAVIAGHRGAIVGVGFSTSGESLVTACDGGVLQTGDRFQRELRSETVFEKSDIAPFRLGFACNGRHVVVSSHERGVTWYTAETGRVLHTWDAARRYHLGYGCLALSADGRRLAGSEFMVMHVWDTTQPHDPSLLGDSMGEFDVLALSPDGSLLAAAAGQGTLACLGPTDFATPRWNTSLYVHALTFSPDGRTLAVGTGPVEGLVLLDPADGRTLRIMNTSSVVRVIAFTPDGRTLAAAGVDRVIRFWEVATGELLGGLEGHLGTVTALAFSPDGSLLASGGADGLVRLWFWRDQLAA